MTMTATQERGIDPSPDSKTATSQPRRGNVDQIVSFCLGDEEYALDIMNVQEIILCDEITAVPQVPDYVRGLINLRGHVTPIIDLRRRFGMPAGEPTENTRVIVVNIGNRLTGIVVDGVNEVLRVSSDQIEPPPTHLGAMDSQICTGLIKLEKKLVILLDVERLLSGSHQELVDIAQQGSALNL